MKVAVNVQLSKKQQEVLDGMTRFTIFRAGRRLGKTYLASYALLKYAATHSNSLSWYVCLDISTCVELAIPQFEAICPPELIKSKNRQTRTYTLINGARIVWKTAETYDALRGRGLDFVVLEEAAWWPKGKLLWYDVLRPQLTGNGGRALFISSPNGSNWMRQLEVAATELIAKGSKEWSIFTGSIFDNPRIAPDEIATLRASTPATTWNQEYLGLFEDKIGLVYWDFIRAKHCKLNPPITSHLMNIRGLDYGLDDDTACVWIAALDGKKAHVFAEHSCNGLDVPSHARIIKQKTADLHIKYTTIDQSCYNRDASQTSVARRFEAAGIPVTRATKDLDGSLSDVKTLLSNGDITIGANCLKLMDALETWQHGSHEPDILAAFRYAIDSLVRNGLLIPPVRVARQMNLNDVLKEQEELARRAAKAAQHQPGNSPQRFKVYNRLAQ